MDTNSITRETTDDEIDEPDLDECAGCGDAVDLTMHDEDQCKLEHETEDEWQERMRDIADDRAFEAWRERDL